MRPNRWLLGLALLHAGVLGVAALPGGVPEAFVHWTVSFRMKDDLQAKRSGIVEATLACTNRLLKKHRFH
jgi:hypothetical protein